MSEPREGVQPSLPLVTQKPPRLTVAAMSLLFLILFFIVADTFSHQSFTGQELFRLDLHQPFAHVHVCSCQEAIIPTIFQTGPGGGLLLSAAT